MITRSILFSLKCTRNRLAAGLRPDPLGELKRSPYPIAVLGGWDPGREGKGGEGGELEGKDRKGGEGRELEGKDRMRGNGKGRNGKGEGI